MAKDKGNDDETFVYFVADDTEVTGSTLQAKSTPHVIAGHRLAMTSTDIHGLLSHGVFPFQSVQTGLDQLSQVKCLGASGGSREMVKAFLDLVRQTN